MFPSSALEEESNKWGNKNKLTSKIYIVNFLSCHSTHASFAHLVCTAHARRGCDARAEFHDKNKENEEMKKSNLKTLVVILFLFSYLFECTNDTWTVEPDQGQKLSAFQNLKKKLKTQCWKFQFWLWILKKKQKKQSAILIFFLTPRKNETKTNCWE